MHFSIDLIVFYLWVKSVFAKGLGNKKEQRIIRVIGQWRFLIDARNGAVCDWAVFGWISSITPNNDNTASVENGLMTFSRIL